MLRRFFALAFLFSAAHAADFPAVFDTEKGAPMPAEEVARTMELPPGFRCQVFAAEPDVQQPIAMNWDKKGRLWVAENYTFAETPKRWDTTLHDRIIILEDKDGDGKSDGRKVFWDKGSYLTSVEVGHGGVWILNAGTLSFIADKNGDDIPDGEPQVLLDGFNVLTIGHNIVNGLRWGPDGWLYGRHGITDTSAVGAPGTPMDRRTKMNCAMWRYHPTRKTLEVVCHGGTNSWGHDWDENGQLFFINTVIGHLWHSTPGAYYRRMFGTHLNSHSYEVIEQTADHFHWDTGAEKWSDIRKLGITGKTDGLGGGHAHVGMMIYQGGTWPKEYAGTVMTCNLHGNRINVDRLERQGNGYVGKHAPDFMKSKDKWFRGIDLLTAPDGNVVVSDWSDAGECHDNDGVHRTSGRIYKISYGETKKAAPFDVAKMSDEELVRQLESKNNWWVRKASEQLNERFSDLAKAGAEYTKVTEALAELIKAQPKTPGALRSGWLAQAFEDAGHPHLLPHLFPGTQEDAGEHVRALFIRNMASLFGDISKPLNEEQKEALKALFEFAQNDASGLVRLEIASALQRLPLEARFFVASVLAMHEEDSQDRQQPLMIWYGIEPAVAAFPENALELVKVAKIPTVRRLVTRRLAEDIEKHPEAVNGLVALALESQADGRVNDIIKGLAAGLDGLSKAQKPKGWDELAKALEASKDEDTKRLTQQLSIVFGSGRALDELLVIIKDAEGDASARQNALQSVMRNPKPELQKVLLGLINDKVLGTAARNGLAAYDDAVIPKALLGPWPQRSVEQQAATVNTLASRPSYALALLDAVKAGRVPLAAISAFQARQIRALNDAGLTEKLTAIWGELRDTPAAKKEELAKWTALLTPEALTKGDAVKGHLIFSAVCGACHKMYGEGGAIGPDLTGGDRHKLTYLLENILDPNAIVPADYRVSILKLKDGRTLTGVIPEQNPRTITVQTPAERLVVERTQITEQKQLPMSLMPEGQLAALGEEQVKHLIAYLMSNGPVAK
jgi:putative membrane-bound dehydrogenase-like protein